MIKNLNFLKNLFILFSNAGDDLGRRGVAATRVAVR
jgi:hypothetical protein